MPFPSDATPTGRFMTGFLDFTRSLQMRDFVMGLVAGTALAGIGLFTALALGAFRSDSEALILSADYRASRTETELREEVRSLQSELEALRRDRSPTIAVPASAGF